MVEKDNTHKLLIQGLNSRMKELEGDSLEKERYYGKAKIIINRISEYNIDNVTFAQVDQIAQYNIGKIKIEDIEDNKTKAVIEKLETEDSKKQFARLFYTSGIIESPYGQVSDADLTEIVRSSKQDKCYETLNISESAVNGEIREWLVDNRKRVNAKQAITDSYLKQKEAGREKGA